MTDDPTFAEFLARVRGGDAAAAVELVRRYEPAIRVVVRARLGADLRRRLDTMDVCQSVLGTFFARAALGQFDLASPGDLVALLAQITRNKLAEQARYQARACRDDRGVAGGDAVLAGADAAPPPDRVVEARDVLRRLREQLGPEEREIADRRADGQDWAAVAAAMGGTPDARRKQLARAIDRVAPALGLTGWDDE